MICAEVTIVSLGTVFYSRSGRSSGTRGSILWRTRVIADDMNGGFFGTRSLRYLTLVLIWFSENTST